MMMVPALQEAHEAFKARRARMSGAAYADPAPKVEPSPATVQAPAPAKPEPEPEPEPEPSKADMALKVGSTRKHQIMALTAVGYSRGRIAARLDLTKGAVSGVINRFRQAEHKVLLGDVSAALFSLGFDTYEIAATIGEPEPVICRELNRARDRERAA